jgi:hypothetical protein
MAKCLFNFLSPLINKPPVALEAWQFLKEHGRYLCLGYAFLSYLLSSLKLIFNRSWQLGWRSLGLVAGFYFVALSYWLGQQGFALKTFLGFSFFMLLVFASLWRLFILKKLLEVDWASCLHPLLLSLFRKGYAYFKGRPSAIFVLSFLMLLSCGVSLYAFNQIAIVEKLADLAYVSLVIGVLLELVRVIRHRNETE